MTDSTSSHSTTPMLLTPESTGSPDTTAKKARRQTAFYPHMNSSNKPQKPFSRSAAKRESVMALGSIEHLQHYFTKTGLVSKQNPLVDKYNLKPAIGGLKLRVTSPTAEDTILELPPSPEIPSQAVQSMQAVLQGPHIRNVETDPETLLPGMIDDLIDVSNVWSIDPQINMDILTTLKTTTRAVRSVRNYVLSLPDESAGTIRAQFRPMSLSTHLPGAKGISKSPSKEAKEDPLTLIRKAALEVLTVLRELEECARLPLSDDAYDAQSDSGSGSGSGAGGGGGGPTKGGGAPSHSRVASPADLSDVDTSSSPAVAPLDLPDYSFDPDSSITYIQLPHKSVPVWEDEDASNALFIEDEEKRESWDDKLVLQSGWLYKQDITLSTLSREKEVVERYLDVVDEALFRTRPGAEERGWVKEKRKIEAKYTSSLKAKRRRTSTGDVERALGIGKQPFLSLGDAAGGRRRVTLGGVVPMLDSLSLSEEPLGLSGMPVVSEEESHHEEDREHESGTEEGSTDIDESELPIWARHNPSPYPSELERAHALLVALLPADLLPSLHSPSDNGRLQFLESLSSGQLLCVAYNTGVRRSRKPWGFVAKEGVHDILSLERASEQTGEKKPGGTGGWTFRRTDNLRLFVGALKLRYGVGVVVPPRSAAIPSKQSNPSSPPTSPVSKQKTGEVPLVFDPKVVASKTEGWDEMLERLVSVWVDGVVSERRAER